MKNQVIVFVNLLLVSLVVGTMFGIWLIGNPSDLPPNAYISQQQHNIRALNTVMPMLGLTTALVTLIAAFFVRTDRRRVVMLVVAFICLMTSGWVTRFCNQPINAMVMTWNPDAPPANWSVLRDQWWQWHQVRTGLGMIALCLLIVSHTVCLRKKDSSL